MGQLDDKGVCFQSKGQNIKFTSGVCGQQLLVDHIFSYLIP